MPGTILCTRDGAVATVILSNPDKLNAIDIEMWKSLAATITMLAADNDIRCVLLRGAGNQAFAAGGDIEEFLTRRDTVDHALDYHAQVSAALQAIGDCRHPTVALIQGACIGGGLEIAAQCDLRICSETSRFGAPINKLGFSMYPAEMEGLLRLTGEALLTEILLEGRILDANEAYAKGLVTRISSDDNVVGDAYASAARICDGAPLVAGWHKQWMRRLRHDVPVTRDELRASFAFLDTDDYREGLAAFLSKRKPVFNAR